VSAVAAAARLVLGALFVWASATKIPDMAAFAESIANYRLVPPALVPAAAAALVGVELLAGLALIANVWSRAAATVLAVLLAVFTAGLASALARGIDLACGCFGDATPATWWTVLRDVVLLALAVGVAWTSPPRAARVAARPAGSPADPAPAP
jgi:putative oxidoreductase